MNWQTAYLIVAALAAVFVLNASYVRRSGFGKNPEAWIGNLLFACVAGALWPVAIAVVPGKLIVRRSNKRKEWRRVHDATVEQLASEEARRVR